MSRRQLTVPRIEGGHMGRRVVVEINCDRCTRTEHLSTNGAAPQSEEPIFKGSFLGVVVEYKDLCTECKGIIAARWTEITRPLLKASPKRIKSEAKIEAKAAVTPPPVTASTVKSSPHGTSPRS